MQQDYPRVEGPGLVQPQFQLGPERAEQSLAGPDGDRPAELTGEDGAMSRAATVGVVVLLLGWAVWGVLAWPKLKRALAGGNRAPLIREYRQTIVGQLVLAALAIAAAGWAGLQIWTAPDELAIGSAIPVGELPAPVLGGIAAAAAGAILGAVLARRSKRPTPLAGDIAALIPVSRVERRWFAAVCVCVGVCEELLYRGFMAAWLADLGLNGVAVLIVGSLFFGLAHAYQGVTGVLVTTALGALLHLLYVGTGALWAPMALHALLDLRLLTVRPPVEQRG